MPKTIIALMITVFLFFAPQKTRACEVKLLLALDVSSSVSYYEYNLQKQGHSAAFRDPEVQQAINALDGGLLVAVTQWAGPDQQVQSIGWTLVRNQSDATVFADRLDVLLNPFTRSSTATGSGLQHASAVLAGAPMSCRRIIIDISTDGTKNTGIETAAQANALAAQGVTINALAIMVDQGHFPEDIVYWLLENVVRGPASFIETAATFNEYPEAFRKKLLRELRPQFAQNR